MGAEGKGEFHPPKNKMAHRLETVIMLVYSAIKNMANLKLEYSVWNPATSSCSASGKSNGTRLVSAMAEIKKHRKPTICGNPPWNVKMFQESAPHLALSCLLMMSVRLKLLAIRRTPTTDMVMESS